MIALNIHFFTKRLENFVLKREYISGSELNYEILHFSYYIYEKICETEIPSKEHILCGINYLYSLDVIIADVLSFGRQKNSPNLAV